MHDDQFDIVVIGSGPGGYRAAVLAALRGRRVAIVEKAQWGGCCLNRGCVPKKAWYHSARLLNSAGHLGQRGIRGGLAGDLAQAWQHQHGVVARVRASYLDYLQRLGVARFEGWGRLRGAGQVVVRDDQRRERVLDAAHIILATGASPVYPQGFEPVPDKVLGSDELFDRPVPAGERVAVLGGGVVATELAYILHCFGKRLSWYARGEPLARSAFTPQARERLLAALAQAGLPERRPWPQALRPSADGVQVVSAQGTETVDWVLVATGRRPHTAGLGLEQTRVRTDDAGFIRRNAYLQTDEPSIYAIGDCASPVMTANQALADASVAVHNIVAGNSRKQRSEWVPQAVYSAVELARLGLNDDQAEDAGFEPAVGFAAFETSPRALGQDDSEGFVRILADMDTGALLGGEIVGAEAGELIHVLAAAGTAEDGLRRLARLAYNHPARAEELLNAVETMAGKWGMGEFIFDD